MPAARSGLIGWAALVAGLLSIVLLAIWWWFWFRDGVGGLWIFAALSGVAAVLCGTISTTRNRSRSVAPTIGLVLGALVLTYLVVATFAVSAD